MRRQCADLQIGQAGERIELGVQKLGFARAAIVGIDPRDYASAGLYAESSPCRKLGPNEDSIQVPPDDSVRRPDFRYLRPILADHGASPFRLDKKPSETAPAEPYLRTTGATPEKFIPGSGRQ